MSLRKLILGLLILFSPSIIVAEAQNFTHFNTSNSGLSYDGVSTVMQDSRGFMWVGTYKGLNRFNGNSFKSYYKEDLGLSNDYIFTIKEAPSGNIWIGTDNGVTMYDYTHDRFVPLTCKSDKGTYIHNKCTFITTDPDGTVWMLVNNQGVFRYTPSSRELKLFPYSDMGPIIGFRKMLHSKNGSFYTSCYHMNLFVTDNEFKEDNLIPVAGDYFKTDEIEGIFEVADGTIYVTSTKGGISALNPSNGKVTQVFKLPEGPVLLDAHLQEEHKFWLSTTDGVWTYDITTRESCSFNQEPGNDLSLSGTYITCSFVDRSGGIWIGTKDGGLNYSGSHKDLFRKVFRNGETSLTGALSSGFAYDNNGNIWAATEQKGLIRYDMESGYLERIGETVLPKTICSPVYDEPYLWLGSLEGLFRLDTRDGAVKDYGILKRPSGINDPRVYMIYKDSSGTIYAGTTLGIFIYDKSSDNFNSVPCFDRIFVTSMDEDLDGVLWLSTFATGVYQWDKRAGGLPVHYSTFGGCGLEDDKVSSVFVDSHNQVWAIGFSHGIALFDRNDKRFVVYNGQSSNMPTDVYFRVLEDKYDNYWMASDKGLVQFNPKTKESRLYTVFDGLLDSKMTNSAIELPDGEMYFGSDNGFIHFRPSDLYRLYQPPSVIITQMRVGDKTQPGNTNIDLVDSVILNPKERSFGFEFALLGMNMPATTRVQARLKGYDDNWHDILASRSIFFYDVGAGNYALELRVSSGTGEWMSAHKPLKITARPVFFLSPLGLVLDALIAFLVIGGVLLLVISRDKRKRRRAEEQYRKLKDEEMFHEKMNFFSHIIHEIKTPLTLIKTPLGNIMSKDINDSESKHDLEVMKNSSDYLSRLVNELLDFVRIEKRGYVLNMQNLDIIEKLSSLVFDFTDTARNANISLSMETAVSSAVVNADPAAMDKILSNLLLNAVKYADSTISIKVETRDDNVIIRFANDGATIPDEYKEEIFKPFVQYHSGTGASAGGVGIGLALSKDLTSLQGGDLLLDDDDEMTCFTLSFPLIQSDQTLPQSDEVDTGGDEERPKVLVADDNKELVEYISSKLSSNYEVIIATNGDLAMKILLEQNIDFLITDISMPGKTGLELCREIRNNIEISHLPIIILSARASVASKIEAMEAGADLYIEKPFDLEYLRSSIKNILDRRLLLRTAFNNGMTDMDINMFGLPHRDEEFLKEFDGLVRNNLSNSELSLEFLADNLNMSKSTLTRKIRKLLNTSPNNYIRMIRLSMAAQMLSDPHGNSISDICYTVGFSSVSYFAKCFKEQFGKTPSEYAGRD